jgi:hypothetical protein
MQGRHGVVGSRFPRKTKGNRGQAPPGPSVGSPSPVGPLAPVRFAPVKGCSFRWALGFRGAKRTCIATDQRLSLCFLAFGCRGTKGSGHVCGYQKDGQNDCLSNSGKGFCEGA